MKTAAQVLEAFDNIRRAQRAGVYAPHKPLLILLALARVQRNEPRLVEFTTIDTSLQALLTEFGPSGAAKSRHYPFWHLATDGQGALWSLNGPRELLGRPAGATPNLGELRTHHVQGGFPPEVDEALRKVPANRTCRPMARLNAAGATPASANGCCAPTSTGAASAASTCASAR
jgi:putative restriction endonuclease